MNYSFNPQIKIKIAVDWKNVALRIVQEVHSRSLGAICCQIFAAPRIFLAPATSVINRASTVEPHSGGATNLLTDPSLETSIALATFVDTAISSLNKASTILFKNNESINKFEHFWSQRIFSVVSDVSHDTNTNKLFSFSFIK